MRDEDVRTSCFSALDVLRAEFGDDIPYRDGLDRGFAFRGRRVPLINIQKGIYRAAAQRGPAALSVQTSWKSPYDDEETDLGFLYAYRAGSVDHRTTGLFGAPMILEHRWSTSSVLVPGSTGRSTRVSSPRPTMYLAASL